MTRCDRPKLQAVSACHLQTSGGLPTLKVASAVAGITSEGDLWDLFAEQVSDLLVGDIAHLVVVLEEVAHLVANTTLVGFHQRVACPVIGAHVAVYTIPAVVAFAAVAFAHGSVLVPPRQ